MSKSLLSIPQFNGLWDDADTTYDVETEFIIASDISIPANIHLNFVDAGKLTVNAGATVTIHGAISAPEKMHVFAGAGRVIFSTPPSFVYPTWFGAKALDINDASKIPELNNNDSYDGIMRAMLCWDFEGDYADYAGKISAPTIRFPAGIFYCSKTIHVIRRCVLEGSNSFFGSAAGTVIAFPKNIKGVKLWGSDGKQITSMESGVTIPPSIANHLSELVNMISSYPDVEFIHRLINNAIITSLEWERVKAVYPEIVELEGLYADGYYPQRTTKPEHKWRIESAGSMINNITFKKADYTRCAEFEKKDFSSSEQWDAARVRVESLVSHGIHINSRVKLNNVNVRGFHGHGIFIDSVRSSDASGALRAYIADDVVLNDCKVDTCEGHGIYCLGSDAQAGVFTHCMVYRCGGVSIYDNSLGNTWVGCHVEGLISSVSMEAYKSGDEVNKAGYPTFIGCYLELDPSAPGQHKPSFSARECVIGGNLSFHTGTWDVGRLNLP